MPKVYLPLASAEAYGAFGEMIVFQGVTCRAYVVPSDPRSPAQLDVRKIFHDVTKMETFCGEWVRAAWKTAFGSRWYTSLYKRVTEDGKARYIEYSAEWDGFTNEQKEAWNEAAPFKVTYNPPGEVFYVLLCVVKDWFQQLGSPDFEIPLIDADSSVTAGVWAGRTLEGVLTAGAYDDDFEALVYSGDWSENLDASAEGGSYHQSGEDESPSVGFYFYGTQFSLTFRKGAGYGIAKVATFGSTDILVEQYHASEEWQQEYISPVFLKGLHYVTVTRTGAGAINIDGIVISARVRKTSIQETVLTGVALPTAKLTRTEPQYLAPSGIPPMWRNIEWEAVRNEQGMFNAYAFPGRVTAVVAGYYYLSIGLDLRHGATNSGYYIAEVRKNGVKYLQSPNVTLAEYRCQFNRVVWMDIGDYLEVWVFISLSPSADPQLLYTRVGFDDYPWFDCFLLQRETLKVENVTLNQYVGTDHGAMNGLDDDDHPQYLTEERGDERYSQIGHDHDDRYVLAGAVAGDGWMTPTSIAPIRIAADDPVFTIRFVGVDLTAVLQESMPVKWTQNNVIRFGFINSDPALVSGSTEVTVLTRMDGGSANYDVLDTGTYPITDFQNGLPKQPGVGFPVLDSYWTSIVTYGSVYTQPSPTAGVYYNPGGLNILKPLGQFEVQAYERVWIDIVGQCSMQFALSTSLSSPSHSDLLLAQVTYAVSVASFGGVVRKVLGGAKTTLYLLINTGTTGASNIRHYGTSVVPIMLSVKCAYL
jgi:hypothetical protein